MKGAFHSAVANRRRPSKEGGRDGGGASVRHGVFLQKIPVEETPTWIILRIPVPREQAHVQAEVLSARGHQVIAKMVVLVSRELK